MSPTFDRTVGMSPSSTHAVRAGGSYLGIEGTALRRQRSHVRIVSGAPLRYKTGHAKTRRFCARSGDERAQEYAFCPHDANFFRVHFDALGERAEVIATVPSG
jgi:hypothetical protein